MKPAYVPEPQIRRMWESDLDEILAIERASFSSPWSRNAFENEMRSLYAHPLVAVQSAPPQVLGYLCFWLVVDECHILNLAVHPSFRRRGVASWLLERLVEVCEHRRVRECYLEVRVSNRAAIALYQKCGFRECGVRRRYYPDTGEDALVMKRRLSCP